MVDNNFIYYTTEYCRQAVLNLANVSKNFELKILKYLQIFFDIKTRIRKTGTIQDKSKIFLNFGNNGDFDVTEDLLPCLKSSRNTALNEP